MSAAMLAGWSATRMPSIRTGRIVASERDTALALIGGQRLMRRGGGLIDAQPGMRVASSIASIDALEEVCELGAPRLRRRAADIDEHRGDCAHAVDRVLALELECSSSALYRRQQRDRALREHARSTASCSRIVGWRAARGDLTHPQRHVVMPASWRAVPSWWRSRRGSSRCSN